MAKDLINIDTESLNAIVSKCQSLVNTAGNIRGQVERFRIHANKAEDVLERVPEILASRKNAEDATTFIKALVTQIAEADEVRLTFTRPLDEMKGLIKGKFDTEIERLEAVKAVVEPRLTAWLKAEEARVAKEKAAEVAAQKEQSEKLANALRAAGEEADAEELERMTDMIVSEGPTKTRVLGTIDGGAGLVTKVTGKVDDGDTKREFLKWAAVTLPPEDLAEIKIGQRLLNRLAKGPHAGKIPGLEVVKGEQARVA
jgi:hypothetical protein